MQNRFLRSCIALLIVALIGLTVAAPSRIIAQDATPEAAAALPEGPLGEQIQWLVDYLNLPEEEAAAVDLTTVFAPSVLSDVPADQLQGILSDYRAVYAPVSVDTETMAVTKDLPPTNATFNLIGTDGTLVPTSLTVDPTSGLITSLWFSAPVAPVATTAATETVASTGTATALPTEAPTETPTAAPTETATPEPTQTAVPTETATELPTETATSAPTETPVPTETATELPTQTPTPAPTETPVPTETPTEVPTETPTAIPTETPTEVPTETPTNIPTETATDVPTETATEVPTETPTAVPTETATLAPTETATVEQTEVATEEATPIASPAAVETEEASPIASPEAVTSEEASPVASPEAVESEEASPVASPVDSPFGDSAIGQHAAWTWAAINADAPVPADEIEEHIDPSLLQVVSAEQISSQLATLQETYGPFTLNENSVIMTANEPPTNLRYSITGKDGATFDVALRLDPATGLLNGFSVVPSAGAATPAAAALPAGLGDTDVSFTSGDDTIFASFMAPESFDTTGSSPAALIISGSGATDRDGTSSGLPLGTNRNLAITLAEAGIPSLRYDKVGSGETGLGSHVDPSTIDYTLYLQEAKDAADYLAQQPGVDPSQLILVGHSEGALFALALADELTKAGTPPAGVILVAPLSVRYLDLITEQLTTQLGASVDSGEITEADAAKISDELASIVDSIRTTGELPATIEDPSLAQLFSPSNLAFLSQIDQVDPGELAAGLPSDLPVLVLLGAKDAQVTGNQVRHVLDGFSAAGNDNVTFVALPKADHSLRIIEGEANPAVDYANPDLEFSPQAVSAIDAFLEKAGLASA